MSHDKQGGETPQEDARQEVRCCCSPAIETGIAKMTDLIQELIHEARLTRYAVERAGIPLAAEMGRQAATRLVDDPVALRQHNRETMKRIREREKGKK